MEVQQIRAPFGREFASISNLLWSLNSLHFSHIQLRLIKFIKYSSSFLLIYLFSLWYGYNLIILQDFKTKLNDTSASGAIFLAVCRGKVWFYVRNSQYPYLTFFVQNGLFLKKKIVVWCSKSKSHLIRCSSLCIQSGCHQSMVWCGMIRSHCGWFLAEKSSLWDMITTVQVPLIFLFPF